MTTEVSLSLWYWRCLKNSHGLKKKKKRIRKWMKKYAAKIHTQISSGYISGTNHGQWKMCLCVSILLRSQSIDIYTVKKKVIKEKTAKVNGPRMYYMSLLNIHLQLMHSSWNCVTVVMLLHAQFCKSQKKKVCTILWFTPKQDISIISSCGDYTNNYLQTCIFTQFSD